MAEPPPSKPPRPDADTLSIAELVRRATQSADRRTRVKALAALARRSRLDADRFSAFQQLAAAETNGLRSALVFLARLPGRLPAPMIRLALPMLRDKSVSATVRIAAAGRILEELPDEPKSVQPVLKLLTAGLSRTRLLERLIQLQSRVKQCRTLDKTITATEAKVKYRCPKCRVSYTRRPFIRHLWDAHKLIFEKGTAVDPRKSVESAVEAGAKSADDPAAVDTAFRVSRHYYPDVPLTQVLQAIAARGPIEPNQVRRLLEEAADREAGLCPVCLTSLADPIPRLPPPLSHSEGRLAGEDFSVEVLETSIGPVVEIDTPTGPVDPPKETTRWSGRMTGAVAAGLVLVAAMLAAVFVSRGSPGPLAVSAWLVGVGWLVYFAVRFLRNRPLDRDAAALNLAWSQIVPGIGRRPPAVRFLVRLCRSSIGEGDHEERTPTVWEFVEQAAVLADKGGVYLQFLAAARVLQAFDSAEHGQDRVGRLAVIFDAFWRGEVSPGYAEAAAEAILDPAGQITAGERGRLAMMVLATAFDTGCLPIDVAVIDRFCPWFHTLLGRPEPVALESLHAVWKDRMAGKLGQIGESRTIFELVRSAPSEAVAILADHPDAWLVLDTEMGDEPVVLGGLGLVIGGKVIAGSDTAIEQIRDDRGDWLLALGRNRVRLKRKLPTAVLNELREWLRYRIRLLEAATNRASASAPPRRAIPLLSPLVTACPLCRTSSITRRGMLGAKWAELVVGPKQKGT